MKHINIYNTTEEYNAAKSELYTLEHFVAYNKESNELLTKDIVNVTFNIAPEDAIINYSIDNENYDQVASNGVPIQVTYKSTLYYKISKSGYSNISRMFFANSDSTITYTLSKTANVGDVIIYKDGEFLAVNPNELTNEGIPIGIVAIPSSHDVYGDGSCGVVSLNYMSLSSPNTGCIDSYHEMITIGYSIIPDAKFCDGVAIIYDYNLDNKDTPMSPTVIAIVDSAQLARPNNESNSNEIVNIYDSQRGYYYKDNDYCPSPYTQEQNKNSEYSIQYFNQKINALSEFDGSYNTKKMVSATSYDWSSAEQILDTEGFPAACCCQRYYTEGTAAGDWYLPTCGEAGYIFGNSVIINQSIEKISEIFQIDNYSVSKIDMSSSGYTLLSTHSSIIDSAYNTKQIYYIDNYNASIIAIPCSQDYQIQGQVRAFLKLKL